MKTLASALPGAVTGILVLVSFVSPVRAAERTLDLSVVPMTISQPGTYVARRDWDLPPAAGPDGASTLITVVASDVVIDLRGFKITFAGHDTAVKIKGTSVTVRNGSIDGDNYAAYAIRSSGVATAVENLTSRTNAGSQLLGRGSSVRNSTLSARFDPLIVGTEAVVQGNRIYSATYTVTIQGNDSVFRNNEVGGGADVAMSVRGNHNLLSDNVFSGHPSRVIDVIGDGNGLARNTVLGQSNTIISIAGSGNTIEGTLAPPEPGFTPATYGITLLRDGNFLGNNRLAAQVPINTNGTVQTDWGGNVAY